MRPKWVWPGDSLSECDLETILNKYDLKTALSECNLETTLTKCDLKTVLNEYDLELALSDHDAKYLHLIRPDQDGAVD